MTNHNAMPVHFVPARHANCSQFADFAAQAVGYGPTVARMRLEERAAREPHYPRKYGRFARNRDGR
jgi:hypothetical protein